MLGGHKIISVCISKLNDERNYQFIESLNAAAVERDFRLFLYQTCSDLYWRTANEEGELSVFELIDYDVTDLVIIFDETFQVKTVVKSIREKAKANRTPVISVGRAYEDTVSFVFNYKHGFEQIVRHLTDDHKITDLHFLGGIKGEACSEERLEVFRSVLTEKGIPVTDDRISYGDYWKDPTVAAVERLIREDRLPKGLVCANDNMAVIASAVLRRHGIVPAKDILVTGFDGTEEAGWTVPAITTAECDCPEAGKSIIAAAAKLLSGAAVDRVNEIRYTMRTADSCGCRRTVPGSSRGDTIQRIKDRFHRYQDDERKLYEVNASLPAAKSPKEFSERLGDFNFYDVCIFVNNDVLDFSIDPESPRVGGAFDETMALLFKANVRFERPEAFARRNIIPDAELLLDRTYPFVFSALNFMNHPCGYLCFYFSLDYENYCKIPQYVTALNNAVNGFRSLNHQRYMTRHIEEIYRLDYLTGLLNRKSFFMELAKLTEGTNCRNILIVAADLDGLKYINDHYGHEEGDFAIRSASRALQSVPIEPKLCARFGGDELVLCAAGDTFDEQEIKRAVTDCLAQINRTSGKAYPVSVSLGVCVESRDAFTFDRAYKTADAKMYSDKTAKPHRREA
ncbi:MAG: GGDEF domain-containing protein [Lachnospiraceae bacterium]|nr:GGDEF domain-containing protein [Lachnospiraceae bacterium]